MARYERNLFFNPCHNVQPGKCKLFNPHQSSELKFKSLKIQKLQNRRWESMQLLDIIEKYDEELKLNTLFIIFGFVLRIAGFYGIFGALPPERSSYSLYQ
jgi:hypothetical protein